MTEKSHLKCAGCSNTSLETEEERFIINLTQEYKSKPGALIPVLQTVQQKFGYLSESTLKSVAEKLNEPLSKVFGVVTFYSYFSRIPRGKYLIRICMGTACYVRGAQEILDRFKAELGIDVNQTSKDRLFTLEVARCFGTCGLAPAIMVGDTVHQRVTPSQVRQILASYRKQESGTPV